MMILLAAIAASGTAIQPAFEPMVFLIGHCWEGKFDGGETDRHCFESVYDGQHIRDRHEVTGTKGVYRGETIYSREGQAVSYTYWNSLGGVSRGSMKPDGDKLDFGEEKYRGPDGKEASIATHWQRKGPDAYEAITSSIQMPSMNRTVVYRRADKPVAGTQ